MEAVGGGLEMGVGAAGGAATSWTGVGAVIGGAAFLHGTDVFNTGVRQLLSGHTETTATASTVSGSLRTLGVPSGTTSDIGSGVNMGLGIALSAEVFPATAPSSIGRNFWSGPGMQTMARNFAEGTGGSTLEMTTAGRLLDAFSPIMPARLEYRLWGLLARPYAAGSSHYANAFVDKAGWVWSNVERPILVRRGVKILDPLHPKF